VGELTDAERADVAHIFESHHAAIMRTAARFAPHPDAVPDIVQTVGERLCRGYHSYKGTARLSTWLYSVVKNTAMDARRRSFEHERRQTAWKERRPADPVCDPDDEVIRNERIASMLRAIDRLPENHRDVLRNQIADSGVIQDRATSGTRAFRAREALRSMMGCNGGRIRREEIGSHRSGGDASADRSRDPAAVRRGKRV
jgi:RNA polymerase sigma-70 factor, ECF subfamily